MARLGSEEEAVSSEIGLILSAPIEASGRWWPYRLELKSGHRRLALEPTATQGQFTSCVLCLEPIDELALLCHGLRQILEGHKRRFAFEPQEPNWGLEVAHVPEGLTVFCWLDAGNQLTDHYTWDALGIRFFTKKEQVVAFIGAIETERDNLLQ